MFDNLKFKQFIENYKDRLIGSNDLLTEAKYNYRAKKLLMFYALKDDETFNNYLRHKEFCELLGTLKYVLETIKYHPKYGSDSINNVSQMFYNKYFKNLQVDSLVDESLVDGAYKFLNDYTGQSKLEELTVRFSDVTFSVGSLQFV